MALTEKFLSESEEQLTNEFLENGYVICDANNPAALDELRSRVVSLASEQLGAERPADDGKFLNELHKKVSVDSLNDLRMFVYRNLNNSSWCRPSYFSLARNEIEQLVGNELAMQNAVNLSIQLPGDDSSLINIHADSFTGETPFQAVLWVPLVDVYQTKSMFILSPERNDEIVKELPTYKRGLEEAYLRAENDFTWLELRYGQVLLFNPNLLHGNIVNQTSETRWSLNCRFTGLFTPYGDFPGTNKKLGFFYLPISTRAVSKVGLSYEAPSGFSYSGSVDEA